MGSTVVTALEDVLDDAATADLDTFTDAELNDELIGLLRAAHRLAAEVARRTNRWDQRTVWAGDGSRSPAARLCRDAKLARRRPNDSCAAAEPSPPCPAP